MAEYSVCLALVLAALLGMQLYVKRGLQGRYKELVDHAVKQASSAAMLTTTSPRQYEPYYVQDQFTVSQSKQVNEGAKTEGQVQRDFLQDQTVVKGTSTRDVQ